MNLTKTSAARRLALGTLLLLAASAFGQAKFPSKPIHLVVPYPPGGTTDTQARVIAQKLTELTGAPVIVENRAGASGNIGVDYVLKAPRDGYTSEMGLIREVVYLGPVTRYIVALDLGGELVAMRQNLETSSQDALKQRGNRVRLQWHPGHTFDLTQEEGLGNGN